MSEKSHDCDKADCYFCYITNRPSRDDVSFRKNGWSTNDIKYLLDNYDNKSVKQIAIHLKKSPGAVATKKYYLNSMDKAIRLV